MVKPIKPSEILAKPIPDEVIEVFNELITQSYAANKAIVKQKDVLLRLEEKHGLTTGEIFSRGWLDVEELYKAEGWEVEYDKPAYNESYDAYFIFRGKK